MQEMREVKLQNPNLAGCRVNDLTLTQSAILFMIEASNEFVVLDRESILRANDILTLLRADEKMSEAVQLFARNGNKDPL